MFYFDCYRDGTLFNITFTPVEYGKVKLGKLIVETDKQYWSYKVEGTFPHYEPPKIGKMSNISGIYHNTDKTAEETKKSVIKQQ